MLQYEYIPLLQVQGCRDIKRILAMFGSLVVCEHYPGGKAPSQSGRGHSGGKFKRTRSPKERPNYPLAVLAEQAGGMAITGTGRILDIQPKGIHQRTPLIMGSKAEVEEFQRCNLRAVASATS